MGQGWMQLGSYSIIWHCIGFGVYGFGMFHGHNGPLDEQHHQGNVGGLDMGSINIQPPLQHLWKLCMLKT